MEQGDLSSRIEKVMEFAVAPRDRRGVADFKTVRIGQRDYPVEFVRTVLEPVLTVDRRNRIHEVVAGRTYDVATVVEGLANVGNVSAVMRTAEAFGFQPFHVVAADALHKISERTTQGAHKWLDVHAWNSAEDVAAFLKSSGYQIVVTALTPAARDIEETDFSLPTAIVFGNEVAGVSEQMLALADEVVAVRTPGFVESFNISVAAAVCLYHAYRSRHQHRIPHAIAEVQRAALCASFYARSVRDAEAIVERAFREQFTGNRSVP